MNTWPEPGRVGRATNNYWRILVLDSEGLSSWPRVIGAHMPTWTAPAAVARVAVSAITLFEVLRGGPRDAAVHQLLSRVAVRLVTPESGAALASYSGRPDSQVIGAPSTLSWPSPLLS
jgi:hypothetical protein